MQERVKCTCRSTPPQLSQLLDSADEAKTVHTACINSFAVTSQMGRPLRNSSVNSNLIHTLDGVQDRSSRTQIILGSSSVSRPGTAESPKLRVSCSRTRTARRRPLGKSLHRRLQPAASPYSETRLFELFSGNFSWSTVNISLVSWPACCRCFWLLS